VVTDSLTYIGAISAGMIGVSIDNFGLFARAQLIPGMQMAMKLRLFNDSGFEQFTEFNIPIGLVFTTTPLGPDAYGYLIYDVTDTAYADCPTYDWVEITPALGGSGTLLTGLNDAGDASDEGDQNGAVTLKVLSLPFPFSFYGETYNQITVCVNGFIAMGVTANGEFRNYHLPGGYGPSPMIAAFWDDLILIQDAGIYQYYDAAGHRYIIQYNKLRNGYNRTSLETFQVIFYDPLYYPTSMGDGMIKIQYKDFNNVDVGGGSYTPLHGNYASIGIKDHTNTRGLEYSYNNIYSHAAAPLSSNKAILITTVPVLHEGAYLTMQELIVNDPNSNGIAEPGETLELGFKLVNIGISTAQQPQLTATTSSPYATFLTGACNFNDIPGDSSGINRTPLTLQISTDCPNEATISFICTVSIAGNSWQFPLSVTVKKPAINISGIYMNDSSGNNNGIADPGETIDLIVNLSNNSSLEAKNILCFLTTQSTLVTIQNSTILLPGVPASNVFQAVYQLELSPDLISGSTVTLNLQYSGAMIASQNEQLILGIGSSGMNANFENDNGSFVASPATNGWEWGESSQGAHSGTKVWGTLLYSQYASNATYNLTSPSVYISGNVVLEFWHRYDAELTYDGGQVRISNNDGSTWTLINPEGGYPSSSISALSGPGYDGNSGGWVLARFNLSAYANQTVKFRFIFKSDSMIEGQGWFIDDVRTFGFVEYAGKVSGTVSSSDPDLEFNKVIVQNSLKWGVRPNEEGDYTLYLPLGTHQLNASCLGYKTDNASGIVLSTSVPSAVHNFYLGYFAPPAALSYTVNSGVITLTWLAPEAPEFQVTGYYVYRKLNAGHLELFATVTDPVYTEELDLGGIYTYNVVCNYLQGSSIATSNVEYQYSVGADDETAGIAIVTRLMNNYPNPFNPETTFSFSLKERSPTRLSIYNLKGQLVKTLIDKEMPSGTHKIVWNGRDASNRSVASGIYLYRLESKNFSQTKRAILMK
jgi:hypothetical protein